MTTNKPLRLTSSAPGARGRPSQALLDARVRAALRIIDDPIALEESELAYSPAVAELVATKLRGRTCARGLALAMILRASLEVISRDLQGTPVGVLADGLRQGRKQVHIAWDLSVSEEHLSRRWKPILVRLVRERIEMAPPNELAA